MQSANRIDPLGELSVGPDDALLVAFVNLVGCRNELRQALEPYIIELTQILHRLLAARRFAQRRLVRPRDRKLVFVDAVFGLCAVHAFLCTRQSELDDLDALDLAAHGVSLGNGLEKALHPAAVRGGGADIRVDFVQR